MAGGLTVDAYEFARNSRGRCFVRSVKIGDRYVAKCFCNRCPKCGANLPSMLATDGSENCIARDCDYQRQVFSPEELGGLGK